MIEADKKFEEVHIELWGPHYPSSLSGNMYAAIVVDAKTRKSWIKYLQSKDAFIDMLKIWMYTLEV